MPEAKYWRIAQDLRAEIESGRLPPGEKLANESDLGRRYGASRNTIRDAVKMLISRGLVETRPGQGTFVVTNGEPFVTTLSPDPESGLGGGEGAAVLSQMRARGLATEALPLHVEIRNARADTAALLAIPEGTQVVIRHQEYNVAGTPWSIQTSFYPMDLVAKGAQRLIGASDIQEGTVQYLADVAGIAQAGYRDTIAVRAPDASEARFFRLPDDGRVAVIVISRTAYARGGTPFRLTVSVFPADRNQFVINSGEVPQDSA